MLRVGGRGEVRLPGLGAFGGQIGGQHRRDGRGWILGTLLEGMVGRGRVRHSGVRRGGNDRSSSPRVETRTNFGHRSGGQWSRVLILRAIVGRLVVVGLLIVVRYDGLAGLLELFTDFGAGILKLAEALAQAPRQLRNFISTEENEDDDHYQHELGAADVT